MFQRLINWLALTRTEQRVILFLSATLVIGAGIRLYQEASPPQRQFDYHSVDSSFAAFRERVASDTVPRKSAHAAKSININLASKDELIGLPGIGQVIAARIVQYREDEGDFASIEELQKVKGISKKKFEKLKPYVTVQ
jgi:comEA protein